MKKMQLKSFGTQLCAAVFMAVCATPVVSLELIKKENGTRLDFNGELASGVFSSGEDYSGEGRSRVDWTEGYLKFGFDGETPLSDRLIGYGTLNSILSFTRGDGDALGLTIGNETEIDIEDAVVGLRFSDVIGENSSIDISFGSQNFIVGDGFLINGDSLNAGNGIDGFNRGGAYWLAARKAFRETAILKFDSGSGLRGDVFYLGSDTNLQGDVELAGVNLEYGNELLGSVGLTYLKVVDVNTTSLGGAFATREDLETISLRAQGSAGVKNLFLSGEVAFQTGSAVGTTPSVDATAYYGEVGYTFADLPWAPTLGYRFSHFSGDEPGTAEFEGFDPLFYGFNRGYGTWFQGEVAGNFSGPFNTNSNIHMIRVDAQPSEKYSIGARYFNFSGDESGGQRGHEFNLFAEIPVNDHLFISPLYGYHKPESGFAPGTSDNHYFQAIAIVKF